jgi:PAS domain S-box-containing protein
MVMESVWKRNISNRLGIVLIIVFMGIFSFMAVYELALLTFTPGIPPWQLVFITVVFAGASAIIVVSLPLQALINLEEKFRIVADFTYNWEYWIAPDNSFVYMTPSCERITGYTAEEFYQKPALFTDIIHPDDKVIYAAHRDKNFSSPEPESTEFRITNRDGQIRWFAHTCQPIYSSDGKFLGRRSCNRDITEIKQAEAALQASNERYLSYIREAAMRLIPPVEVVSENLISVVREIESGEQDYNMVVTQLTLQTKNMEQIRLNIIDLNKTIVNSFGEISAATEKFLTE